MPLASGEGPVALLICPARELARQTHEVAQHYVDALNRGGLARMRTMLCIGGEGGREQMEAIRAGVHVIVATPGRLKAFLNEGKISLDVCK